MLKGYHWIITPCIAYRSFGVLLAPLQGQGLEAGLAGGGQAAAGPALQRTRCGGARLLEPTNEL